MNYEEQEYTFGKLREASLTREEREDMRRNVRLFMAENPIRPTLAERFFGYRRASRAQVYYFRPALAGLLIVLLVSGGTSYVAADALPGDFLYTIKTAVNENVEEVLAFSDEAKANLNAKLAVRRLEEAETLASEGRLSPEVSEIIEVRFEEHAEEFETKVASLTQKEDMIEAATEAQSDLETSLKVHAAVLADLSLASELQEEVSLIVQVVEKKARSVELARVATERTISKKTGKAIETAAAAKKRSAQKELSSRTASRDHYDADIPEAATMMAMKVTSVETDMSTTSDDEALDEFQRGSESFEEGKYGEAFTKFQSALRAVKKEKLDTDIRKRLNIEFEFASFEESIGSPTLESERGGEGEVKSENENENDKEDGGVNIPDPTRF